MDNSLACMANYDSFFSFYRRTPPRGIHGTAIFTKKSTCVPLKAEEGIGYALLPDTLPESERIGGYPLESHVDLEPEEMRDLDLEGRTTICDFGLFVLINLWVLFLGLWGVPQAYSFVKGTALTRRMRTDSFSRTTLIQWLIKGLETSSELGIR